MCKNELVASILYNVDYLRENRDTAEEAKRRDDGIVEGGKAVQGPEATDRVTHLKTQLDLTMA
jgi:hypothetical protein